MAKHANFEVYKGKAAAKFQLKAATETDQGIVERKGCIFLEVAPAQSRQVYDWKSKITFAIGINDLCKLLDPLEQSDPAKRKLIHDQSKNESNNSEELKTLEIVPGEGQYEGTYQIRLSVKRGESDRQFMVPLTAGEYRVMMELFRVSIPKIIGWDT